MTTHILRVVALVKGKWQPKDVVALAALAFCFILMMCGHNHAITWSFCGIIGAYVGVDIVVHRRR